MNEVTLVEVLVAAHARKAPLAPESAGYLTLAVADALVRAPLSVVPDSLMLSSEGTLSIRGGDRGTTIEAEQSLRDLLAALLGAAPSPTPALAAAARRQASGGVASLVAELEAALIPVNRAAARRALARIARETDRARGNLRVPANVIAKPRRAPSPSRPIAAPSPPVAVAPPVSPPMHILPQLSVAEPSFDPDADAEDVVFSPTPLPAIAPVEPPALCAFFAASPSDDPEQMLAADPSESTDPDALPTLEAADELTVPITVSRAPMPPSTPRLLIEPIITLVPGTTPSPPSAARLFAFLPVPEHTPPIEPVAVAPETPIPAELSEPICIAVAESSASPSPALEPTASPEAAAPIAKLSTAPAQSVESLLEGFSAGSRLDEREVTSALKRSVGLEPTPPPPAAYLSRVPSPVELPMPEPSQTPPPISSLSSPRPPRAPRTAAAMMFGFLLLALGATIAVWSSHPAFFAGR